MGIFLIVLSIAIACAASASVLLPLFGRDSDTQDCTAERLKIQELQLQKSALIAAIRDLDLEKGLGTAVASEYEATRASLLSALALVVQQLDNLAPQKSSG